jgi:hypothetical protein
MCAISIAMRTQQISPSVSGIAVTPNDTTDLAVASLKGWSVNGSGYVKVLLKNMSDSATPLTIYAVAGARYPDIVRRFMVVSTNSATGIIAYS